MRFKVLIPIILFAIVSVFYFPELIKGKKLYQSDISQHIGMAKEATDFYDKEGEQTLWTNSAFGGMPMYLIGVKSEFFTVRFVQDLITKAIPSPAGIIFITLIAFYILLLSFKVDYRLAAIGALAYGFSTYFMLILEVGHNSKMVALAYLPGVLAGVILVLKRQKLLLGTVVFALFLSYELIAGHLQMTYYGLMMIVVYGLIELYGAIKDKVLPSFLKGVLILSAGALIAIGTNFVKIYSTYEYGKQSLRGPSELTIDANNQTSGLDKDYATDWSYGKMETFNMFIPNLFGGASVSELSEKSATYDRLLEVGATKKQASEMVKQMPTYWGDQPGTSGPTYIGAIVIFLFLMGVFLVKGKMRIWLISVTVLSMTLAWGKNFMFLTDFFFDYVPGYSKFRAVSSLLVIAQISMPLLGILALKNIVEQKVSKKEIINALKYSVGILGGLVLLFIINPGILSFTSDGDARLPEYLRDVIVLDRESIMRSDAIRSLVFVIIGAASIWLLVKGKLKLQYFYIIIGLAILVDLWAVDKRFLKDENFVSKRQVKKPFSQSQADTFILKDNLNNARVLNMSLSTFNDASTSYFHKSIGGYSGAKMRRYQEVINFGISKEMQDIIATIRNKPTQLSVDNTLRGISSLNMLNTRYIITNPAAAPIINNHALGNAWFVDEVQVVKDANEEISAIQEFDPSKVAIVDKRFEKELFDFTKDTSAQIDLVDYKPNHLTYKTSVASDQLAVFSEIYYDKGWQAFVDGKAVPHFRVNYILRAMEVPSGEHVIEFKFQPKSWAVGNLISLVSSILLILASLVVGYFEFKKKKQIA